MSNENFVKPFLEALHKTILIVNFPRNGKLYIMQKIAHMQAAVHNSGECQAFAPDCGIYFSPISGLLCIMNETQLVSRQIKMQDWKDEESEIEATIHECNVDVEMKWGQRKIINFNLNEDKHATLFRMESLFNKKFSEKSVALCACLPSKALTNEEMRETESVCKL